MEMSNERKPLLSDEEIIDETWVPDMSNWEPAGAYEAGMHWARRYYEDLITTGKLRVVEEVKSYHEILFGCPSCKSVWDKQPRWSQNGKIRTMHYCPGCGNKIRR